MNNNIYNWELLQSGQYDPDIIHSSIIKPDGQIDLYKFQRGLNKKDQRKFFDFMIDRWGGDRIREQIEESKYDIIPTPPALDMALPIIGESHNHMFSPMNPHSFNYIYRHKNHSLHGDENEFDILEEWNKQYHNIDKDGKRISDLIRKGMPLSDNQLDLYNRISKITNRALKDPSEFYRGLTLPKNKNKGSIIPFYGPTSVTKNPMLARNWAKHSIFGKPNNQKNIPNLLIIKRGPMKGVVHGIGEQEILLGPNQELKITRNLGNKDGLNIIEGRIKSTPNLRKRNRLNESRKKLSKFLYNPKAKKFEDSIRDKINELNFRIRGPKKLLY